jgi:Tfp pilus assembly protein PilO
LLAGVALMLFAGWRVLVHPQALEYATELAKKQDLQQQLQTARDTAAQFGKFKAQAENMRRDLDFYSSRTDINLNKIAVSEMVNSLAHQMGLEELKIDVQEVANPELGEYNAHVSFKSDFDHLGKFYNACVSQRCIMVPDSVSLNSVDDPSGLYFDTLSVDLSLLVYGGKKTSGGRR